MKLTFLKYRPNMVEKLDPRGRLYILAELALWHEGGAVYTAAEMDDLHRMVIIALGDIVPGSWRIELEAITVPVLQAIRDAIVDHMTGRPFAPYVLLEWRNRLPQYIATWSHREIGETEYFDDKRPFRAVPKATVHQLLEAA